MGRSISGEPKVTKKQVDELYAKAMERGSPAYKTLWEYAYYTRRCQQNFIEYIFDIDP